MKSAIAGVLILIGLVCLVGTKFVGNIDPANEFTETEEQEYAELSAAVHAPSRDTAERKAQMDKLRAMQLETAEIVKAAKSKKSMMNYAGMGLTILGICAQIWAWTDKKA